VRKTQTRTKIIKGLVANYVGHDVLGISSLINKFRSDFGPIRDFVGFVGSQLPPPPITGTIHQVLGHPFAEKKSSADPKTVLTCPLFWQIRESIASVPFIELPLQLPAVSKPAFMSGAPDEQSKKVVQQAFSPAGS
jgi:hypothetical protein